MSAIEPVSAILKDAGADLIREAIDGKVAQDLETSAAAMESLSRRGATRLELIRRQQ